MEVTTVSPPPASPTEGDDLCETDVTDVAIHSVTLLICLCGLVGNGAVLGLLRQKQHNTGIVFLTVIDFLFLLFIVPSAVLFLVEDVSCSPIMSLAYLVFVFILSGFSCYTALICLIPRNAVYMNKLFKLCCCCDLSEDMFMSLCSCLYIVCFILLSFFTIFPNPCLSQEQEQCRAALISVYAIILLLLAATTVISSTIKFIKARRGSKKQQRKTRDIVLFLIVLFTLLLSLCNFLQQLGYIIVSSQVVFLLNCIHSSIKPFIYFLAGRCWSPCALSSLRLSLQRVFEEQEEKPAHGNDALMDTGI